MALDYVIIGERLKNIRIQNNLTQEKLAEKLDMSVAFLSKIERGKTQISLRRLNQICELLEISEGAILNGASTAPNIYLNEQFNALFKDCPPEKLKLIYNISKLLINSED